MASLCEWGYEDFIREKVEQEQWTHYQVSSFLKASHPGQRGMSVRSVQRFCSENNIKKTSNKKTCLCQGWI